MSQPEPIPNNSRSIHDLVMEDLEAVRGLTVKMRLLLHEGLEGRKQKGLETYGTVLQAHNGRDALLDLWEEMLDATCYAHQAWTEDPDNEDLKLVYNYTLHLCAHIAEVLK